jgi:hypothetical protein
VLSGLTSGVFAKKVGTARRARSYLVRCGSKL